ncbi:MAG: hypothetical protein AMXMBFR81_30730 [Chthonomonas sp.]
MAPTVYMLRNRAGFLYVGVTNNLDRRLGEHWDGTSSYTARFGPWSLVWMEECQDFHSAFALEKQLKGWSRAKKEAMIAGDSEALKRLSKPGSHKSETD